jgi:uncharacterized protein
MKRCIIDSGFLYALIDEDDAYSDAVRVAVESVIETVILPSPALTEVAHFVQKNMGQKALATFIGNLREMKMTIQEPTDDDLTRCSQVLATYADQKIDFVDALIFAMAERLNVTRVLTIDRRHFRIFRPKHCPAFEILP